MTQRNNSTMSRRQDATASGRGVKWFVARFVPQQCRGVEVTKLRQSPFGQMYRLRYPAFAGAWAELLVVARTGKPDLESKDVGVCFTLANGSQAELLKREADRHAPRQRAG